MTEPVLIALIGTTAALGGSLIGGILTYRATKQGNLIRRRTAQLIRAYEDIAAFHRLEARYIGYLASPERTAESWKKQVRREQADANEATPGEDATDRACKRRIAELIS